MLFLKKVTSIFVAIITVLSFSLFTASAQEDFTMKSFDKGYVTFIFDDGKMPFTKEVAELFKEYNMPMSCAIVASRVQKDSKLHKVILSVQENGGEILSHGYKHLPITSEERSKNPIKNVYGADTGIYTLEGIEKELGSSWKRLTNLGLNVNGMIQVGSGGDEGSADYALVESVARKYYKYSNASGLSAQYKKNRTFMNWKTMSGIMDMIDEAIENKEWIILSAHGYNEISSDAPSDDTAALREILEYIKGKNGEVEVVTWNYIYNTFGEYTGPEVPSSEAKTFLSIADDDDVDTLSKNAYIEKPVEETPSKNTETNSSESLDTTSSETIVSNTTSSETVSIESETEDTSSEETTSSSDNVTEDSLENKTEKKNNSGKFIAIGVAAALALISVIVAVIVFIKFK